MDCPKEIWTCPFLTDRLTSGFNDFVFVDCSWADPPECIRKELELQKKRNEEKDDFIPELKHVTTELKDMVSLLKTAGDL